MGTQTTVDFSSADLPRRVDTLLQIRTGKVKPVFGRPNPSGIFKTPHTKPVKVGFLGCEGDEHGYEGHGGPDKALMWYPSKHYPVWQAELPLKSHLFAVGGFGENIVTSCTSLSEEEVCIGDVYQFGGEDGVTIQISEPRQPCSMLNYRFEVDDMSIRCQNTNRTGWYCRVLKEGLMQGGDEVFLIERKHPRWAIKEVQKFLNLERKAWGPIRELSELEELGDQIKAIFLDRIKKGVLLNESDKAGGGDEVSWNEYRLLSRKMETPRIGSFEFRAVALSEKPAVAKPGSHIRVKLGEDGKLVRAYSVVGGDSNRFTLGVALYENSRGGSKYLHQHLKFGDTLSFSKMASDFPLATDADNHILIAGGIGITAFLATALLLKQQDLRYHLYYAVRSSQDVAFRELLQEMGDNVTILNGSKGQRLEISSIIGKANSRTHIYTCGPQRLMDGVTIATLRLGFPDSNIHFEAFTALTSGDPFTVDLALAKKELEVKGEQTLLEVLRDAGFDVPSSCEVGNCGTCKVAVRGGKVEHRGTGLIGSDKEGAMLSCVSRGVGKIVLEL